MGIFSIHYRHPRPYQPLSSIYLLPSPRPPSPSKGGGFGRWGTGKSNSPLSPPSLSTPPQFQISPFLSTSLQRFLNLSLITCQIISASFYLSSFLTLVPHSFPCCFLCFFPRCIFLSPGLRFPVVWLLLWERGKSIYSEVFSKCRNGFQTLGNKRVR